MSLPLFTSTGTDHNDDRQWNQVGLAFIVLLAIVLIAGAGGVLSHLIGPPKALFLILVAIAIWTVAGWFLGGWRAVLAGVAALSGALAASNGNYFLSVALCGLLFLFLSTHVHIVPRRR